MASDDNDQLPPFFWLHIKKSAGSSLRSLLSPEYITVEKVHRPINFIQANPSQYNDILNNFRIPLGEYQFRRCLFAKTYLYPDTWNKWQSFAFVRNPLDRAISAFHYLRKPNGRERSFIQDMPKALEFDPTQGLDYQFDVFLNLVARARQSPSIYGPVNLHFSTHVAPMWDDVTDNNGKVLLRHIFRLEEMEHGLNTVYAACGLTKKFDFANAAKNKGDYDADFTLSPLQKRKIGNLYKNDFDLYEGVTS